MGPCGRISKEPMAAETFESVRRTTSSYAMWAQPDMHQRKCCAKTMALKVRATADAIPTESMIGGLHPAPPCPAKEPTVAALDDTETPL